LRCDFKNRDLAKHQIAGENKPECSRGTRDKLEPDALHPFAHRDQRQQQSDPAEQSDSAKIIAEKPCRLFQFGDHFDECGHGTLVRLLFRQSERERQTLISYYQPGRFVL
jgi:hypothetical protein